MSCPHGNSEGSLCPQCDHDCESCTTARKERDEARADAERDAALKAWAEMTATAAALTTQREEARGRADRAEAEARGMRELLRKFLRRVDEDPNSWGCADPECDQDNCLERQARAALSSASTTGEGSDAP